MTQMEGATLTQTGSFILKDPNQPKERLEEGLLIKEVIGSSLEDIAGYCLHKMVSAMFE